MFEVHGRLVVFVAVCSVITNALLLVVALGQSPAGVLCVESEALGVLSLHAQLLDVGILRFLDFVQELLDELAAAEVLFRFPRVVVAAPAFPVNSELSGAVLLVANVDDFVHL